MKTKSKAIIFWEKTSTKVILAITIIVLIILAIILPSILNARPKGSLLAFNRDATSGTREAFASKVLNDEEFSPGKDVREVKNNDAMVHDVANNNNSVGYVSLATIASFDESGEFKFNDGVSKNINYSTLDGTPITEESISTMTYGASRTFNSFFRVKKDSTESQILNYDFSTSTYTGESLVEESNELKASYLFYSWVNQSTQASEFLTEEGFFPASDSTIDFTNDVFINYATNEDIDLNLDDELRIEIVGSTSAKEAIVDLSKEFEETILSIEPEIDMEFIIATNGSGDAFKETIPGATNAYIGLQSRSASESELSKWGWDDISESDGKYSSDVYNSFIIDAILMIFNSESDEEGVKYTTTPEQLNKLYTNEDKDIFYSFDDIFTPMEVRS